MINFERKLDEALLLNEGVLDWLKKAVQKFVAKGEDLSTGMAELKKQDVKEGSSILFKDQKDSVQKIIKFFKDPKTGADWVKLEKQDVPAAFLAYYIKSGEADVDMPDLDKLGEADLK
jgi:gas vesicle protein